MSDLAALFPDENYRFQLGLKRGDGAAFFRAQDATGKTLAERRRWLETGADAYVALESGHESLLEETIALGRSWGLPAVANLRELAATWEPDVLLLSTDESGQMRLRGGALIFPTGWALREQLGRPVEHIHDIVPGLNAALGASIARFLTQLKPGTASLRANWGLAATPEWNMHPQRRLPAPTAPVSLDRLWLRIERQAFVGLPSGRGLMFGIRIELHRLDAAVREPGVAVGLARALRSMPPDVAAYKRINAIASELATLLEALSSEA